MHNLKQLFLLNSSKFCSHMLEFLNPIDVLYDNNNQHKFKELRKISYVQNLKQQIVKFLNNHGKSN